MSYQEKSHSLDKRGAREMGNAAEETVVEYFTRKGQKVLQATKQQDTSEFIDIFVINKKNESIPIQCKNRGRTPHDRFCIETKGTTHGGWLNKSLAHVVIFVDDKHMHFININELRKYVEKNMNMEEDATDNKIKSFNNRIRYKRDGKYGSHSEMVFVPSEDIESLKSYIKIPVCKGLANG